MDIISKNTVNLIQLRWYRPIPPAHGLYALVLYIMFAWLTIFLKAFLSLNALLMYFHLKLIVTVLLESIDQRSYYLNAELQLHVSLSALLWNIKTPYSQISTSTVVLFK